jgi:hypothetical protein
LLEDNRSRQAKLRLARLDAGHRAALAAHATGWLAVGEIAESGP